MYKAVTVIPISITISFVSSFRNAINTLYYLNLSSFYKMSEITTQKQRVYKFYSENILKGKAFTWHHFEIEGAKRATVYKYMKCVHNNKPVERQKTSVRKPIFDTNSMLRKVKEIFNHKTGKSRKKARIFTQNHRTYLKSKRETYSTKKTHEKARPRHEITNGGTNKVWTLIQKLQGRSFHHGE